MRQARVSEDDNGYPGSFVAFTYAQEIEVGPEKGRGGVGGEEEQKRNKKYCKIM